MKESERIHFTSELAVGDREGLEALLFFNRHQSSYRDVVVDSIERFGEPRLVVEGERLRLRTSLLGAIQALYAVADQGDARRPVAAALYTRTAPDTMTLLHIAVDADFASDGSRAGEMLTLRLLNEVTRACSRIKGIQRISLLYGAKDIRIQRHRDA